MFNKVKGTQDFLDMSLYNFIIDSLSKHLTVYHFSQIATPIIEHTELFKRSLGIQTDVVSKEMFIVSNGNDGRAASSDKSDETQKTKESETICLRPEATAAIARAFAESGTQSTPWKVFLHGPMFRYERPQKGRFRQFHQTSIEVIGSQSIAQDAQFIKMLERYFHETLKLNNFAILINFIGCFEDRAAYKVELLDFLNSETAKDICDTCKARKETNILRIFDCKNVNCQKIYESAPYIVDNLCEPCEAEWQQLQDLLSLLSVSYAIKHTLVRGLDYYNKTVFEFSSDNLGAQNAFVGGGRYDQLIGQISGKDDQPSFGAAIGIERVMLLLEPMRDQLPIPQLPALHVIIPIAPEQQGIALLLADELQSAGLCTDVLLEGSMKSMMRHANKMAATYCLIIGEDEQATRSVTVKHMIKGTSEKIAQIDLVKYLQ